jgi:MFS-type transporter involved in bile tolerance (Atg22 family)
MKEKIAINTPKNYGFYAKLRILNRTIFVNPAHLILNSLKDSSMRSLESYTIIGLISSLYAIGLNTTMGKKFTDQYTWATVCIGTSIVLSGLRLIIPKEYWYKLATAFVVAGAPMIFRSLYNKTIREVQRNEASY